MGEYWPFLSHSKQRQRLRGTQWNLLHHPQPYCTVRGHPGVFLSAISDYAFSGLESDNWRWMVGTPIIIAIVEFLIVFIAPRTPYFLVKKEHPDEAKEALKKLTGGDEAEIAVAMQEISVKLKKLETVAEKRVQTYSQRCCNGCACLSGSPTVQQKVTNGCMYSMFLHECQLLFSRLWFVMVHFVVCV